MAGSGWVRPLTLVGAALALALTTALVLPGAGSYALWNGATTANAGSVTGGTVSVSEAVAPALAVTFRSSRASATGGVTVTNAGTVASALALSLGLGTGSSSALAAAVSVTVWPAASTASCTDAASVPTGAATSTWGAGALPLTATVPAGGTAAYCIRSAMPVTSAVGVASGASLTAQVAAKLTAGTWTQTATASATQTFVDDIAPTQPSLTLTGSTATSASLSFSSSDAVGVTGFRVYRDGTLLASVTSPTTVYTDAAVTPGSHTYTVTASDAAGNVSVASTGVTVSIPIQTGTWYELVNPASGLCVTLPSAGNNNPVSQGACATPVQAGQEWQLPAISSAGKVTSALPNPANPQYSWKDKKGALQVTSGGSATSFIPTPLAGGVFQLSAGGSPAVCVDSTGGGALSTTTCSSTATSQQFVLVRVGP